MAIYLLIESLANEIPHTKWYIFGIHVVAIVTRWKVHSYKWPFSVKSCKSFSDIAMKSSRKPQWIWHDNNEFYDVEFIAQICLSRFHFSDISSWNISINYLTGCHLCEKNANQMKITNVTFGQVYDVILEYDLVLVAL